LEARSASPFISLTKCRRTCADNMFGACPSSKVGQHHSGNSRWTSIDRQGRKNPIGMGRTWPSKADGFLQRFLRRLNFSFFSGSTDLAFSLTGDFCWQNTFEVINNIYHPIWGLRRSSPSRMHTSRILPNKDTWKNLYHCRYADSWLSRILSSPASHAPHKRPRCPCCFK
jgi:hypothetical protein